jgi:hypothetical protein
MVELVAALFFLALTLLVPAVIETASRACRALRRKYDLGVQSNRESRSDRDEIADSPLADEGSMTETEQTPGSRRVLSRMTTTMKTGYGTGHPLGAPDGKQTIWYANILKYSCPRCWKGIDPGTPSCPSCHFHLNDYENLLFEEKMLFLLRHPIRETCIHAIGLRGESGSGRAVYAFHDLLVEERDTDVIIQIALTAAYIGGEQARALLSGLKSHESALLRKVAESLWRATLTGRTRRHRADDGASADHGKMC